MTRAAGAATGPLPVAVFGADGRMGRLVCQAIDDAPDLSLVARLGRTTDRETAAGASVAVDFTTSESALENSMWALDHGLDVVVGTTGLRPDQMDALESRVAGARGCSLVVVPNFSVTAMLAKQFARTAARYFEYVEIMDLTHPDKVDAPSGTAVETAAAVSEARRQAGIHAPAHDATSDEGQTARGTRVGDVPVHSIRMRGLVSHQEVLLSTTGEQLTIRADTVDRSAFMPQVVRAIRFAHEHSGLFAGLESLHQI